MGPATNGNAKIGHLAGVNYDSDGVLGRGRCDPATGSRERSPSGAENRRGVEAKGRVT